MGNDFGSIVPSEPDAFSSSEENRLSVQMEHSRRAVYITTKQIFKHSDEEYKVTSEHTLRKTTYRPEKRAVHPIGQHTFEVAQTAPNTQEAHKQHKISRNDRNSKSNRSHGRLDDSTLISIATLNLELGFQ